MRVGYVTRKLSIPLLALLWMAPAWSNGDLFFEAQETPGKPEYVVYGSVKDDRGRYLEGVAVVVQVSNPSLSYTSESGLLGRYRSLDVGKALKWLGYDIDPSKIDVQASYAGYHVTRRLSRARHGQLGAIEVDFVLSKDSR
jgi:hypothetical protein